MNSAVGRWTQTSIFFSRPLVLMILLCIMGVALYAPDLSNTLFFDDEHFILKNDSIRAWTTENIRTWFTENAFAGGGRLSDYYRPLLMASFAVNYSLHENEPSGYFLANNILHGLNAALVFSLLYVVSRRKWVAFFVALVFLVHPMQSENVAYVAGRGDLLSSFFILSGLLAWTWGIQKGKVAWGLMYSSILLIGALLSRENAMVFPFLASALYVGFLSRESLVRALRTLVPLLVPSILIVAGYVALRLTVLNFRNFLNFGNVETSIYTESIVVRLYTFLHVLAEYLRTFFVPTNVHERFTFPIHESFFDWPVWCVFFCLVALGALLVFLYRREHLLTLLDSSVSDFRVWLFATMWFFAALLPSMGIIPTNVVIQDHRLYLALVGLTFLCVVYGARFIEYAEKNGYQTVGVVVFCIFLLYVVFLSWLTVERARIWGNPVALMEETLRYEPGAVKAMNALGVIHINNGDFERAFQYLRQGILEGGRIPELFTNMGYIYHYGPAQDLVEAERYYKKALELNPLSWYAHYRLSELYMTVGSPDAVTYLTRYHELRPRDANAHFNLARVLAAMGQYSEALRWLDTGQTLITHDPGAQKAYAELRDVISSQYQKSTDNQRVEMAP